MSTVNRWAALHRRDGSELTEADAPGYRRSCYDTKVGVCFPPAPADWGFVAFWSLWSSKTGGYQLLACQPLPREWLVREYSS